MPRFYVEKDNKWNIFSTVIDDFLYNDWLTFDELVEVVTSEIIQFRIRELETLVTSKPELNIMSYDEATRLIEKRKSDEKEEIQNNKK